jgi:nitroreductase
MTPDELLTTTRSVRKRLDLTRPVPMDLVRECLEIALQAPSGGNRQGWHWIVVTDPGPRKTIGDYYARSFRAYLESGATAGSLFQDDPARAATQQRVASPRAPAGWARRGRPCTWHMRARSPSCWASRPACARACSSPPPTTPGRRSGRRAAGRSTTCCTSITGRSMALPRGELTGVPASRH